MTEPIKNPELNGKKNYILFNKGAFYIKKTENISGKSENSTNNILYNDNMSQPCE